MGLEIVSVVDEGLGQEKTTNPLLQAPDEDRFLRKLLGGLGSLPSYFSWLPKQSRHSLAAAPAPPLSQLGSDDVARLMADGAAVADVRPAGAFTAEHVRGSVSNSLRPVFASWLGWLVEPDPTLVFVTDDNTERGRR